MASLELRLNASFEPTCVDASMVDKGGYTSLTALASEAAVGISSFLSSRESHPLSLCHVSLLEDQII